MSSIRENDIASYSMISVLGLSQEFSILYYFSVLIIAAAFVLSTHTCKI